MNCPHCQTPLADPVPRFCDTCGMSTGARVAPKKPATDAAPTEMKCPDCGMIARTRRCRGCGAPVRWPDGVEPPGER